MKGFKTFLLRGNLLELAVAVVIGAQFSTVVKGLTSSFITPLLGLFGKQGSLDVYSFTIRHSTFTYGAFVDDIIQFVISAAAIYFVIVLPVTRLMKRFTSEKDVTERPCPACTRSIPIAATRCPECTSLLTGEIGADIPEPRPEPAR